MKMKDYYLYRIPIAILFFVCILDARTVISGAADAVEVCLKTVVPSLFPFIFFSGLFRIAMEKTSFPFLRPFGRLCKLPAGCENIFILGLIGGYPVGAKCVYDSYRNGQISIQIANRMLGFCNNAGPAFIIGMVSFLFEQKYIGWIIWSIQIISAIVTGYLTPSICYTNKRINNTNNMDITLTFKQSITAIATVCGWIIIFRAILEVLSKWILWLLPEYWKASVAGILELTNGILLLSNVSSAHLRFLLANLFLSMGGLCIALQTISIASELNFRIYFLEKILQSTISLLISVPVCIILFPGNIFFGLTIWTLITLAIGLLILFFLKMCWKKTDRYCIIL